MLGSVLVCYARVVADVYRFVGTLNEPNNFFAHEKSATKFCSFNRLTLLLGLPAKKKWEV
jgi:hypothetical protein